MKLFVQSFDWRLSLLASADMQTFAARSRSREYF